MRFSCPDWFLLHCQSRSVFSPNHFSNRRPFKYVITIEIHSNTEENNTIQLRFSKLTLTTCILRRGNRKHLKAETASLLTRGVLLLQGWIMKFCGPIGSKHFGCPCAYGCGNLLSLLTLYTVLILDSIQ